MAFKLTGKQKDYLFWIYPLIILGLLVFAVKQDEQKRESPAQNRVNVNTDTSLTISLKTIMNDSLKEPDSEHPARFLMVLQ